MNRDNILYKLRRRGQVLASKFISDELLCKIYSRAILKKSINLKNPKTFNEKIQWLKINYFPNNALVVKGTDKYRVRNYIANKGLDNILVPLIGQWDSVENINWDKLPKKFVIKCNHGCAYNIICTDKDDFDKSEALKLLNKWMNEDFGEFNIERHYSKITPHIICEKFLGENIVDYKFFCFNGIPKFIYVSSNMINDRDAEIGFFSMEGEKLDFSRDDYKTIKIDKLELPSFYDEMKNAAEVLSKDFVFVRVDFFIADGNYYFAELTFTPAGGMIPFNPPEYDYKLGKMIDISMFEKQENI
ncbi:glycosyl transferase [Anaerococcus sp. WCA-380-WT-2B]|uniref:Glycosyl transferase n=1 Tax=Anaerococcus porci TaxID=2652269 RepID=A0A6N7VVG8_9FIRM|nr:ATP-grasp fold amidoligase family protein [Anaerococcus porci]MSS77679.1 glycosyl transferase [Anaerococcus porci]